MKSIARWFVAGQVLGLLIAVGPSCQAPCGPSTCFGCCSPDGECVAGNTDSSCGSAGQVCLACAAGQLCSGNTCLAALVATDGGGTDGGTDAGVTAPTNPLGFTATISPSPPVLGRNTLAVKITGANGVPVDGATLSVNVYMPTHGHGSPETPIVTAQTNGQYSVSKVTFSMQGTWRVTLSATAAGGLTGSQVFFFTVN